MRVKIAFRATVALLTLAACSEGYQKKTTMEAEAEAMQATEVIHYYDTSMSLLKEMAVEKDMNAVIGYMEQHGQAPMLKAVAPPPVSLRDSAFVVNPGNYFNLKAQQELRQNYQGLFETRRRFYDLFNRYLTLVSQGNQSEADKLLEIDFRLGNEMDEYKENIMDILAPFTEDARARLGK